MSGPSLAALDARIWANLRPPRRLTLSTWADQHFVLPVPDPNAGRWRCFPFQRGILDAISDPHIERVSVMKSSRVGYTRCFCAATAYFIAEDPGPILIVQPTIDDAKKHSKEDLTPILREVEAVRGLIVDAKVKDAENTILDKMFRGGSLSLIGANSPRGFRRTSRRIVIFDEVDGYPRSAGTEGDPYKLGERRTATFWNRKIIAGSTPTLAGASKIEELYQQGDQRRYYVPCPICGVMQVLVFEHLKFPDGPASAHFVCVENGCRIEEAFKRQMVEAGEWRAEHPENFQPLNRHASFHIWAAYSYAPNAQWAQLADEYLKAKGSPITLKTFRNTVQGETWREAIISANWEQLARRREPYDLGTVPIGALFLTCGVDVQKDRLVYEVVGWGRDRSSWSIDAGVLGGETANANAPCWAQLDALLRRSFVHATGAALQIRRLAIDSGFNTQHVYAWSRRYPFSRVIPIKGTAGASGTLLGAPKAVEYNTVGRRVRRGVRHWPVYGHVAKDELYGFLSLEVPTDAAMPYPPGFCHFPFYDDEFFKQLTAEHLVLSKTGRWHEYKIIEGRENHALDARIYARAAAAAEGLDRFTERDWQLLESALGITAATVAQVAARRPPAPEEAPALPPVPPQQRPPAATRSPWLQPRRGWLR